MTVLTSSIKGAVSTAIQARLVFVPPASLRMGFLPARRTTFMVDLFRKAVNNQENISVTYEANAYWSKPHRSDAYWELRMPPFVAGVSEIRTIFLFSDGVKGYLFEGLRLELNDKVGETFLNPLKSGRDFERFFVKSFNKFVKKMSIDLSEPEDSSKKRTSNVAGLNKKLEKQIQSKYPFKYSSKLYENRYPILELKLKAIETLGIIPADFDTVKSRINELISDIQTDSEKATGLPMSIGLGKSNTIYTGSEILNCIELVIAPRELAYEHANEKSNSYTYVDKDVKNALDNYSFRKDSTYYTVLNKMTIEYVQRLEKVQDND